MLYQGTDKGIPPYEIASFWLADDLHLSQATMDPVPDKPTVLIADDQEHVREALALLLRGKGYAVVLCASPGEALAAARAHTHNLALLDMNYQRDSTSGIEGLELIQNLRELDPTLPIIALTAWGNVDLAVSAMKHGASDFLEKPWRNDTLLEKVGSFIRHAEEMRSSKRVSDYERENAQQLQTRIVPQRHLVTHGVELFGDSVPAGTVGGDYFGVWQPAPDVLHFCVADVSGKGTPGALIAAMLYASVSTLSSSSNSPEIVLAQVDSTLRNQLGEGHYVTIFYGVLDLQTHVLHFVNAGHCPPILRHKNGSLESLGSTRPVLGFMLGDGFRSERIALAPGDRLLLYTDGVTEAANGDGEEFGTERLEELMVSDPDQSLSDRYSQIMKSVRTHAADKLADDATLLLIAMVDGSPATQSQVQTALRSASS